MAKESAIDTKDISIERIMEVVVACHEQIRQKQCHKPSNMRYSEGKNTYIYAPQKITQAWEQPANTTDYSVPLVAYSQSSMLEMERFGYAVRY